MLTCPHCDEILEHRGQVIIACACPDAVNAERTERARRTDWWRERTRQIQAERERRRKERRRVALPRKI